jgi:hypothetical protein
MTLDELIHEHDFTFVCFRKDGMRAAFTVGVSEEQVSIPIVVIASNRSSVGKLVGAIKGIIPSK